MMTREMTEKDNHSKTRLKFDQNEIKQFVQNMHNFLSHPAKVAFYKTMKTIVADKNLERICDHVVKNCEICCKIKHRKDDIYRSDGDLHCSVKGGIVSIDICGPFYINH